MIKERSLKEGTKGHIYRTLSPMRAANSSMRSPSPIQVDLKKFASPNSREDCIKLQRCYSPLLSPIATKNKEESGPYRIRRIRDLLDHLVTFAAMTAKTISPKQQEEIKLRLNGAFDRIIKYSKSLNNPFALGADTSTQLSQVIEACLRDLEIKLKAIALNGGSSEQDIQQVRTFISSMTEQSAMLDIEELLPKIIDYLKGCKVSQGMTTLKNLMSRHSEKTMRSFFCQIKELTNGRYKTEKVLKMILARNQSKSQYGDLTRTFQSWKDQLRQENPDNKVNLI